jgi:hypothetical protein
MSLSEETDVGDPDSGCVLVGGEHPHLALESRLDVSFLATRCALCGRDDSCVPTRFPMHQPAFVDPDAPECSLKRVLLAISDEPSSQELGVVVSSRYRLPLHADGPLVGGTVVDRPNNPPRSGYVILAVCRSGGMNGRAIAR